MDESINDAQIERADTAPALAAYLSRALAPLRAAAEAYPSARRKLKNIIEELEALE